MLAKVHRIHRVSLMMLFLMVFIPQFTSLVLAQGKGVAKASITSIQTDTSNAPNPETKQPSNSDKEDFSKQFEELLKGKPETLHVKEFKAALDFATTFAKTLEDTKGDPLGDRFNEMYKQVEASKKVRAVLVRAVKEVIPVQKPLEELAKLWPSFKPFAAGNFTDIKVTGKSRKLVEYLRAYAMLDTMGLSDLVKSAKDTAYGLDKSLSDSHKSLFMALNDAAKGVTPLSTLPEDASGEALRAVLKKTLKLLADDVTILTTGKDSIQKIEADYKDVEVVDSASVINYETLQQPVAGAILHLRKRFGIAATDMIHEGEAAQRMLDRAIENPFQERADSMAKVKIAKPIVESARSIIDDAMALRELLGGSDINSDVKPTGSQASLIEDQIKSFSLATEKLDILSLMLQEPNPVNIEQWDGQYINLYYFDDVPRLMKALVGSDLSDGAKEVNTNALQTDLANKRTTLIENLEDLAVKRGALNSVRGASEKRRLELQQTVADTRQKLDKATVNYNREETIAQHAEEGSRAAELRLSLDMKDLEIIRTKRAAVETERNAAKSTLDADPSNKDKQAAYQQKKAEYDRLDSQYNALDRRVSVDQKAVEKANAEKTTADGKRDKAKTDKDGLETNKKNAEDALDSSKGDLQKLQTEIDTQNNSISTQIREMYISALAENAAFANARDNQPYWEAAPLALKPGDVKNDALLRAKLTDPLKRVYLFGFPDNKTIFIRGRASDVRQAREIIASFDRPQAQALMTLWSLELSSQSTKKGTDEVSKLLRIIEDELRVSRAQTDASLTLMRKVINDVVDDSIDKPCSCGKCLTIQVSETASSAAKTAPTFSELAVAFYDVYVFEELRLLGNKGKKTMVQPEILEALLPDPRHITTMAEALVVMSLAKKCHRGSVAEKFRCEKTAFLQKATADAMGLQNFNCEEVNQKLPKNQTFSALKRYVGEEGDGPWIRSFRQEVITQLMAHGGREIRLTAGRYYERLSQLTEQLNRAEKNAIQAAKEGDQTIQTQYGIERTSLCSMRNKTLKEAMPVFVWAQSRPTSTDLKGNFTVGEQKYDKALASAIYLQMRKVDVANYEAYFVADDMLKRKRVEAHIEVPKNINLSLSAIAEVRDLKDYDGLVKALTDKEFAAILSRAVKGRAKDVTNLKLRKTLQEAENLCDTVVCSPSKDSSNSVKQYSEKRNQVEAKLPVMEDQHSSDTHANHYEDTKYKHEDTKYKQIKKAQMSYVARLLPEEHEAMIDENMLMLDANTLQKMLRDFRSSSQIAFDNSREAAANETIKRALKAVDEDLQQLFIEPMIERIRVSIHNSDGVSVGVFNRTQIIASNRLVARVDPTSSSTLNLAAKETNILEETLQLAQLVGQVQSGGALTALTGLKGLKPTTKPEPPAYYGITAGNTFTVTPILDPTGQALRFRFDHVLRTAVREPNGTTSSQLNRFEQTGVNTEVQLSNYEIGLISRFQTNQQLGMPTLKEGGIPVLKHIPFLSEIPLIGWFSRRNFKAAVVQQSLLLGQTAIFPTIDDVVHLLTKPMPEYLTPEAR